MKFLKYGLRLLFDVSNKDYIVIEMFDKYYFVFIWDKVSVKYWFDFIKKSFFIKW